MFPTVTHLCVHWHPKPSFLCHLPNAYADVDSGTVLLPCACCRCPSRCVKCKLLGFACPECIVCEPGTACLSLMNSVVCLITVIVCARLHNIIAKNNSEKRKGLISSYTLIHCQEKSTFWIQGRILNAGTEAETREKHSLACSPYLV